VISDSSTGGRLPRPNVAFAASEQVRGIRRAAGCIDPSAFLTSLTVNDRAGYDAGLAASDA
jgi:hypothetical protein